MGPYRYGRQAKTGCKTVLKHRHAELDSVLFQDLVFNLEKLLINQGYHTLQNLLGVVWLSRTGN